MASDIDNSSARKSAQPAGDVSASKAAQDVAPSPGGNVPGSRYVVVDEAEVDFTMTPKWRKRLRQLDDYQRAAPAVLGRFRLG
jgi:hypothetical protein